MNIEFLQLNYALKFDLIMILYGVPPRATLNFGAENKFAQWEMTFAFIRSPLSVILVFHPKKKFLTPTFLLLFSHFVCPSSLPLNPLCKWTSSRHVPFVLAVVFLRIDACAVVCGDGVDSTIDSKKVFVFPEKAPSRLPPTDWTTLRSKVTRPSRSATSASSSASSRTIIWWASNLFTTSHHSNALLSFLWP